MKTYEKALAMFAELLDSEFGGFDADYFEYHTAREWGIHALSCAYGKTCFEVDEDLEKYEGERRF